MAKTKGHNSAIRPPLVAPHRSASVVNRLVLAAVVAVALAAVLYVTETAIDDLLLLGFMGLMAIVGLFFCFAAIIGVVNFSTSQRDESLGTDYLNGLEDGICISDKAKTVLYANAAFADLTGLTQAAEVQTPEQLFSEQEAASTVMFRMMRDLKNVGAATEEVRLPDGLRADDDTPRWYRLAVRTLSVRSYPESVLVWTLRDITAERDEQERTFLQLQQAINHLDQAPVGFFATSPGGSLDYVNATLASWLGLDLTDFSAGEASVSDILGEEQATVLMGLGAESQRPRTIALDVDMLRSDGSGLPVQLLHRTSGNADGLRSASRTMVINRAEVSNTVAGDDANDLRFRRFFNATPMAIAALDDEGRIVRTNNAFLTMFAGLADTDAVARRLHFDTLLAADARSRFARALNEARANRADIEPFDTVLPLPGSQPDDETAAHVRIFVNPVAKLAGVDTDAGASSSHDDGEIALVYVMDTSEQKALEQQMAQSQKMQAVGQLAGGIAHDFNNVLTAIIMASDLLLTNHRPSDPSFPDIMNIKQNANRAAALVRQLLAFSRRQTLRPEVLSITDVLADMRMLLTRLIGNDMQLEIDNGRDLWPVRVDLGQFEQVIVNLCVNARDAMPSGGKLIVRTRNLEASEAAKLNYRGMVAEDYVLIDVIDTGTGIEPEVLKKIFEPFFTTKDVGKGTGLGLSMVYGIIKQTGGHIHADSVVGQGTTFRIFLPRHEPAENEMPVKSAAISAAEPKRDMSGQAHVLLVEDEDAVRLGGVRALQSRGYTVHEASSGIEALELMEELGDTIDIIVSDVVMPEMDGPTLLREVRSRHPDIKFVFVSGYAQDAFARNLPEGQQFGFLPKPFSLKQLATTVKETLEG